MMRTRFAITLGALGLAAAVSARPDQTASVPSIFVEPPAAVAVTSAPGAAQPDLAVNARGIVFLTWLEPAAKASGLAFRLARVAGMGPASPPSTIVTSEKLLANWADFPSVFASSDGRLAVHWLERGATRAAYGVRVATSSDGGSTWSTAVTPHQDDSASEHGFVSFFEAPTAGLGLIWLDGREMAGGHGAAGHGAMTLRSTTIGKNGAAGAETTIDARVCDCCQTSAARTANGVIVAYRDRTDKEIRDIAVSRLENGAWTPALTLGADNWEINGCPVNGPVVAAQGNNVAVAWFTAVGNAPKTQIAFSTDGGKTFGAPLRVDASPTVGRVGLALLAADRALVSSIERTAGGAQLVVRDVRRSGVVGAPVAIAPVSAERPSGFPRMVVANGQVIFAWTEITSGQPSQIRVARARIRP